MKRATLRYGRLGKPKIISIHALVKRATYQLILDTVTVKISIHALVKRATDDIRTLTSDNIFQSTPS